jgi:nicotinamidase-related amidase
MSKASLIIIDGQNDFIEGGALAVDGGTAALDNVVEFIRNNWNKIDDINATMDSHPRLHIAHPIMWINSNREHPDPFTIISESDVKNGVWRASKPQLQAKQEEYVTRLANAPNRFPLCIWPPHCIIGSPGHGLYPALSEALQWWEEKRFRTVNYVTKGSNPFREHYSAIKAEVIDENDVENTGVNTRMIQRIQQFDKIIWTGIAGSHCLNYTCRDAGEEMGDDYIKKFVLFDDCTVPVKGFEPAQDQFFSDMSAKGMTITSSDKG